MKVNRFKRMRPRVEESVILTAQETREASALAAELTNLGHRDILLLTRGVEREIAWLESIEEVTEHGSETEQVRQTDLLRCFLLYRSLRMANARVDA